MLLKNLKIASPCITEFLKILLDAANRKPRRLQTDKNKEFFYLSIELLIKQNDIQHSASESNSKAAVVERFN